MALPVVVAPLAAAIGGVLTKLAFLLAGAFIARVLLFFGLSFVVVNYGLPDLEAVILAQFNQTGDLRAWLLYLQLDVAITVILSAVAVQQVSRVILGRAA